MTTERRISDAAGQFGTFEQALAWLFAQLPRYHKLVKVKISIDQQWTHEGDGRDPAQYPWSAAISGSRLYDEEAT